MKGNLIKSKTFNFALKSIEVYKFLLIKNKYVLFKRFLKSATSIEANVEEADAGYSKNDFFAKMSIASKEARKTLYWIKLIETGNFIEYDFEEIKQECNSFIRILTAIVKTSQSSI
jgi:four helix bundle protein